MGYNVSYVLQRNTFNIEIKGNSWIVRDLNNIIALASTELLAMSCRFFRVVIGTHAAH